MQQQDSGTSHSIAIDSRKLAEASTHDSSSMKAIAVLTMVFLPSTAVAVCRFPDRSWKKTLINSQTIFSMGPFFDSGSFAVSSNFWLYWVVSVPTTLIVLLVWQIWLRRDRRLRMKRDEDIEEDASISSETSRLRKRIPSNVDSSF